MKDIFILESRIKRLEKQLASLKESIEVMGELRDAIKDDIIIKHKLSKEAKTIAFIQSINECVERAKGIK